MKSILLKIVQPRYQEHWFADLAFTTIRFITGMLLALDFGASKFGLPWSSGEAELSLFEVAPWFVEDVSNFGGVFTTLPVFFAWTAAFGEAIGGLLLALGLKTRIAAFLIMCTMLGAIFLQKWGEGTWGMLPAMGFLWVSIYHLYLGSGRFGLDHLIIKYLK